MPRKKASVAASWLGARPYPQERLHDAWFLTLEGQMHDILPGTATPKAYEFVWNDDAIAMNQFSDVLTSAAEGVASGLDTQAQGTAVVVYNPLNVAREDIVEADIRLPDETKATQVSGWSWPGWARNVFAGVEWKGSIPGISAGGWIHRL